MAGKVIVDNERIEKAGIMVSSDSEIKIKGNDIPYVSRGGIKLAKAIEQFDIKVKDLICIDVGASTGGFTDCLLQNGAKRIFAVDVGYGQFAWKLRQNPRIAVIERTNIRKMKQDALPCQVDLAVIDVSFISLKIVVPATLKFLNQNPKIIALVKPQFEVGKENCGKGVVRDDSLHKKVIDNLTHFFTKIGLECISTIPSPILGPKGNKEFFLYLEKK